MVLLNGLPSKWTAIFLSFLNWHPVLHFGLFCWLWCLASFYTATVALWCWPLALLPQVSLMSTYFPYRSQKVTPLCLSQTLPGTSEQSLSLRCPNPLQPNKTQLLVGSFLPRPQGAEVSKGEIVQQGCFSKCSRALVSGLCPPHPPLVKTHLWMSYLTSAWIIHSSARCG